VDFLEELFDLLWQEPTPKTEEYLENRELRDKLGDKIEAAVGTELMDKFIDAHWEYMEIECRRYLLNGIRLGIELLRL
jgi:hypothetical protein